MQQSPIAKDTTPYSGSRSASADDQSQRFPLRADGGEGLHGALRQQFRSAASDQDILASPSRVLDKDWAGAPSDKMAMERTVAKVNSALTERQQRVDTAERDLAQLSSVCNRSVHRAEERVTMAQGMYERSEAELARRDAILRSLQSELATKRRDVSQFAVAVEEDRKRVAELRAQKESADGSAKDATIASEAMRSRAADDRADIEVRISTLQRELATARDQITNVSANTTSVRASTNTQIEALRQQCSSLRRAQQDELDRTSNIRSALSELCEEEESAVRRFRAGEEEKEEEGAAARRLAVQDVLAVAEGETRERRSAYERAVEDYRKQIDATRDELLASEKEGARLKESFIVGRQRLDALQSRAVHLSGLKGRTTTASERAKALTREVEDKEEALKDATRHLQSLTDRVMALKDIVAPAAEVSDSIAVLNRKAEQKRQELADGQSQHLVLGANKVKAIKVLHGHCKDTLRVIEHRKKQISESNEDAERGAEEIATQLRVIEVETATMEDNIRSLKERNDGLASALDIATREKQAMADELYKQKEAARKAASGLLEELTRR